jgi:hypothetical protein
MIAFIQNDGNSTDEIRLGSAPLLLICVMEKRAISLLGRGEIGSDILDRDTLAEVELMKETNSTRCHP